MCHGKEILSAAYGLRTKINLLWGGGAGAGCCLISGFPSSSKMLGSYFGHHPYKKGVTECKYINETYNEQTQEPFPDAHNTQRLFFFSFPCFS